MPEPFWKAFYSGGSEIILQDHSLLQLVDANGFAERKEEGFIASLPSVAAQHHGALISVGPPPP